jgi:hypothetical protein
MVGPKPPDGSIIAQGEEPAGGCADLNNPSHASIITSGYFPSALRTSVAITPTSESSIITVMIVSIFVQVVGTKMALTGNPGIPYFAITYFRI